MKFYCPNFPYMYSYFVIQFQLPMIEYKKGGVIMKTNKGFTLVELIIVVAIIAVLATVLAPQYLQYVERSRESNDLQLATNIMDASVIAAANPQNNVPAGRYFTVFWSTDTLSDSQPFGGMLCVTLASPTTRESVISNDGATPVSDVDTIEAFAKELFTSLGVDESDIVLNTGSGETSGWWAPLPEAQSLIANQAKFYFHIHTSTGQIALAEYVGGVSNVGSPNQWLDIGVNAIPAP